MESSFVWERHSLPPVSTKVDRTLRYHLALRLFVQADH
jgi:hypothetical protein